VRNHKLQGSQSNTKQKLRQVGKKAPWAPTETGNTKKKHLGHQKLQGVIDMSIMQHRKTSREAITTNTISSEVVTIWTANRREDNIPQ
jgi:hypothetical protein